MDIQGGQNPGLLKSIHYLSISFFLLKINVFVIHFFDADVQNQSGTSKNFC